MKDMEQHKTISSQQLFFVLNGAILGSSVFYDASSLIGMMKENAWMAPLIGGAAMLLDVCLITALASRYPGLQLAEYSDLILGRYLGKLPTLLFIVFTTSIVGAEYELTATISSTFLLPNTPLTIPRIVVAFMIIYAVTGGIDAVARLNQVLIWALVVGLLLFLPQACCFDMTNLLPVGHVPISSILKGTLHMGYSLVGAELLMVWYPRVSPEAQVRKASLLAYVSIIMIDLYLILLALLVLGPDFAPMLVWAPLSLLKMIDLPALGRVDFYAFLLWLAVSFRPMVNYLHGSATALKGWLKPVSFSWCTIILMLVAMGLTYIPGNISELLQDAEYVGWLGLATAFPLPALLLLVDIIRHGWRYRYENQT